MKYLFSRFLDILPDWDWITRIVECVPEKWCDQAD